MFHKQHNVATISHSLPQATDNLSRDRSATRQGLPFVKWHFCHVTSCQLPEEDCEIWSQRCVAYETFSLLVPDNDLKSTRVEYSSTG